MHLTKRSLLVGIVLGLAAAGFVFAATAYAQQAGDLGVSNLAQAAGASATDLRVIIARIIRAVFGVLGIIALVIVLYAGFLWMTSGGDEDKITTARRLLLNAAIGLAIMLSAFGITQFVLSRLLEATGFEAGGARGGGGGAGIPFSGALGAGIIENHYPGRGAVDVPRNTRVVVTFKEAIQPASFVKDYVDGMPKDRMFVEDRNFKLFRDADGPSRPLPSDRVRMGFTMDQKTFVFDPVDLLGSPSENVGYSVALLGGAQGIKKANGDPAFGGSFADGYRWDFIIGTATDITPPRVLSVIPVPDSRNPRNTIIEITFSEAMDPTTVTGALPGFRNLGVLAGGAEVAGAFAVGNAYRTVRFTSADRCGTNACGGDVFCLPGAADIRATVRAATLSAEPPAADPGFIPADGATDMVGNSLDGDGDGTAEGPAADSHAFGFTTTSVIDLTPPQIESLSPGMEEENVSPERPLEIVWNKLMSLVSFTSDAVRFSGDPSPEPPTCYNVSGAHLNEAGEPAEPFQKSKTLVNHCLLEPDTNYLPLITEGVQDTLQNCFLPGAARIPEARCSLADLRAANASYCCSGQPCASACAIRGGRPECPTP